MILFPPAPGLFFFLVCQTLTHKSKKKFFTLQSSLKLSDIAFSNAQTCSSFDAGCMVLQVATRGAVLYFVLADLATVDVMYQFSLTWFYGMFSSCVDLTQGGLTHKVSSRLSGTLRPSAKVKARESAHGDDLHVQLEKMISRLTTSIYKIVSVALFAHHQLMFSFLLSTSILRSNAHVATSSEPPGGNAGADMISQLEWSLFLQGNIMAGMLDEETCKKHNGGCSVELWECSMALWER